MSKPRFYVDERVGCIAVRDRTKTDPDRNGLEPDMPDVVWWGRGIMDVRPCGECGRPREGEWSVSSATKAEAIMECARLNEIARDILCDADFEREAEMRGESREERMGGPQ